MQDENNKIVEIYTNLKNRTDNDVQVRGAGAKYLNTLTLDDVPSLIFLIQRETNPHIREHIENILDSLRDPRALEPLINLAKKLKETEEVDWNLIRALANYDGEAVFACFLEILESQENTFLINVLGALGDKRAVPELNKVLERTQDEYVKICLIRALGELGESKVLPQLIELLNNDDEDIRDDVIGSIESLGNKQAIEPLLEHLKREYYPRVKADVVLALGKLGVGNEKVLETLIKTLKDNKESDILEEVAQALGLLNDKRAVEPLLETFAIIKTIVERNWWVVAVLRSVIHSLGILGDQRALEPFKTFLTDSQNDSDPNSHEVMFETEVALYRLGEKQNFPSLMSKFDHADPKIRKQAIEILAELLEEKLIIEAVIKAVQDKDRFVKRAAFYASSKFKDRRVIPALQQAAQNALGKDRIERREAIDALDFFLRAEKDS